ncbi:hypothetical protein PGT21_034567 [Puccinia graminis f. sp. tritici]|uniref:Aquaporin n=2 Tax=Puccinia graminis f. sp. tritici TaxID=56615 RepID=H6QPP4_PUCGT|nr:uncharacterized protein PGTG_20798 [Puccinia graminis f. sp. tritici CRL 75-36-700-3]EHS64096.1 hypothetical protein PGTG_20798 [Puccinia graminis f. sp. tritici CRL 75-36-700-3]KAA1065313.1 hypothetical protein PGTUg99_022396 [Puccinia graminis f. sp. tritici]KAA1095013.1 hypothetical protein PGT21_034567 [Puccinia graminis f. sp. tritici]
MQAENEAAETIDSATWNQPQPDPAAEPETRGTSLDNDRGRGNYVSSNMTHEATIGRPAHRLMRLQTFSLSELNPQKSPERDRPLYSLGRPFPEPTALRRRSPTKLIEDIAAQMNLQTGSLKNFPISTNRPPESRAELAAGSVTQTGMHILRLGDLSEDQYIVATPELLRSFLEETRNRDSRRVRTSFPVDDHRNSRGTQASQRRHRADEYQDPVARPEFIGRPDLSESTAVEQNEKDNVPVSPKSYRSSNVSFVRGAGGLPPVTIARDHTGNPTYSSRYRRFKSLIREPAAEALASFLLAVFSGGASTQVYLTANSAISSSPKGNYATQCVGSAIAVMIGVYVAGGISGGHLNPTVTISLAIFRDFPWQKVIPYCSAQVFGGLMGSLTIQLIYAGGLDVYEGGEGIRTISGPSSTAGFFLSYPAPYMSNFCSFFQQFLDSTIVLLFIMAIGDRTNSPPPDGISPIVFMCVVIGVAFALGSQTSYALNPALDLSSRIVVTLMGYGTSHWSFRDQYWIWNNWVSNLLGALFGCFLYDFFIYEGDDSPLNRPWSWHSPLNLSPRSWRVSFPSIRRRKTSQEKPAEIFKF